MNTERSQPAWRVEAVDGHRDSQGLGLAWLVGGGDFNNGRHSFEALPLDEQRGLRVAFDYYLGGHNNKPKRHHGWDRSEHGGKHTDCHVFKHPTGARLYGFKCNPRTEKPRFQLCLVVHFTTKHEDATEQSILDRLARLRADPAVGRAIAAYVASAASERGTK